ncbi:MAG: 3-deoxy-manno-octulosonate cytidylyltransferase [Nitrospiraceae bacterium]|nr:3-deoxy-manno-octulosonate cytidylyltransferase [Nitrospiraceae bacterium]
MEAAVVIPARYLSSRFPGKALVPLKGKPLIAHVYEKAAASRLASRVLIATDDEKILEAARSFGADAVMTSAAHPSGTDRVAEAAGKKLPEAEIIVNLQGDEPLIRPEMIDDVIMLMADGKAGIGTLARRITLEEEFSDPNVVKVVFGADGYALYFSRSPIPCHRDGVPARGLHAFKHIGIYAYRRDALFRLCGLGPTVLEETEKLEQLRALENGINIKVKETAFDTIGVDTPGDLVKVERWLNSYS